MITLNVYGITRNVHDGMNDVLYMFEEVTNNKWNVDHDKRTFYRLAIKEESLGDFLQKLYGQCSSHEEICEMRIEFHYSYMDVFIRIK